MVKFILINILLSFIFCFFQTVTCLAQEDVIQDTEQKELDISSENVRRLFKLQDFYSAQIKKRKIPDSLMARYKIEFKKADMEIKQIKEKRISYAEKVKINNPTLLETELFFFQFREMDLALSKNDPPTIYANEIGSLVFNGGVTFLGLNKYSTPITISGEKILNENISVGGYIGHFIEKVVVDSTITYDNPYYTANFENYKHNYVTFGIKGSYHYFNPLFILNPNKFDLYATAILGYSFAAGTVAFLDNEKYLQGQKFKNPKKKGINYGVFVGIRYMHDDNLGFFIEGGYSNTGFVSAGLCLRFLGKYIKSDYEEDIIEFKVKLFSSTRKYKPNSKKFQGIDAVEFYKDKKLFIYTLTPDGSYFASANRLQQELNKKKFKEAEVIAFRNGKLISVKKALKILRKTKPDETEL